MLRLFFHSKNISHNIILISDQSKIHHLRDVLRLKKGEKVSACDEKEACYDTIIEFISQQKLQLKIINMIKLADKDRISLTIACAIPKNARFDDIVDKLTQLGVDKIIPLETQRVIVKLGKKKSAGRLGRWKKIAQSASMQSQRNTVPEISAITKLKDILAESAGFDLKLIPNLNGQRQTLKEALGMNKPKNILILIGPEGDFTPEEITAAKSAGFIPVSLGKQVLRVDTAAIAIASFINLYYTH